MKNSSEKIPDVVDDSGVTPAHFAAQQGHLDCLQVLLVKQSSHNLPYHTLFIASLRQRLLPDNCRP